MINCNFNVDYLFIYFLYFTDVYKLTCPDVNKLTFCINSNIATEVEARLKDNNSNGYLKINLLTHPHKLIPLQ